MKRSVATLIAATSLLVSNQVYAEEIKEAFGIILGEKLNISTFTKVDMSANSKDPLIKFHLEKYGKGEHDLYTKQYNHEIFKTVEVLTDPDGFVAQVKGISDPIDSIEICNKEGDTIIERIRNKYKIKHKDGSYYVGSVIGHHITFEWGRKATGGCDSDPEWHQEEHSPYLKDKYLLEYTITDSELSEKAARKTISMRMKKELEERKRRDSKYKDL